jgi:hypothetical protein
MMGSEVVAPLDFLPTRLGPLANFRVLPVSSGVRGTASSTLLDAMSFLSGGHIVERFLGEALESCVTLSAALGLTVDQTGLKPPSAQAANAHRPAARGAQGPAGLPGAAQTQGVPASATETLDTYAHLWPDSEDRTRDAAPSTNCAPSATTSPSTPLEAVAGQGIFAADGGWVGSRPISWIPQAMFLDASCPSTKVLLTWAFTPTPMLDAPRRVAPFPALS